METAPQLEIGQAVRVMAPNSVWNGMIGTVLRIVPLMEEGAIIEIHLNGVGSMVYFHNELEVVQQEGELTADVNGEL